jgi:hypothetical protein
MNRDEAVEFRHELVSRPQVPVLVLVVMQEHDESLVISLDPDWTGRTLESVGILNNSLGIQPNAIFSVDSDCVVLNVPVASHLQVTHQVWLLRFRRPKAPRQNCRFLRLLVLVDHDVIHIELLDYLSLLSPVLIIASSASFVHKKSWTGGFKKAIGTMHLLALHHRSPAATCSARAEQALADLALAEPVASGVRSDCL